MDHTVGVKIKLDAGDLASSSGIAQQSLDGITGKIKELKKEGKQVEAAHLDLLAGRLSGQAAALAKDIKNLYSADIKVDSEYADLMKSLRETQEKKADELQAALRGGDLGKISGLIPQIEKIQSESHKTVRDIINTNGDFSRRPLPGANNPGSPRIPPLPQGEDWRELKGVSGAITQEHDAGNWEQVAKLGMAKDTLRGIMGQYDRDGKMEAKLKADPEFASQLKEIRDALKGTIAALDEAAASGDYEKVDQLTGQARQLQGVSHKTVQEAAALPDSKKARDAALASFLNVQTAQQIVGAATGGINTYVSHLDRSGIVNAMGGGDVMGARIEELHRSAAEKSALWGSVGRIGGGILGTLGGLALAPFTGGSSLMLAAGGAAIGSTLFGAAGDLVGTLGDEKKAREMTTDEAYAKLWERQAPAAMELTGVLGKYGAFPPEENSRILRRTWENAANTATEYGYSPEEGVEQVKLAAGQGLDERQALDAARDVFAFERGTGADRGALSEFRNRTERFGIADGLNTAWQGNQASGMAPGQFNEFLRSMQKTFEDGISKGFVRGADEIAGNLSFLSGLNGGSELWKGEQGANRLSQMNSGIEATTALSSVSDILSFRGAQNLLKQWDNAGMTLDSEGRPVSVADENWRKIGDLDPEKNGLELRRGYDYIDPMAILERGLTPELFHSQMQMIGSVEKDRKGRVEQMRNIYGLNYTGAAVLDQTYQDKMKEFGGDREKADNYFSGPEWAKKLESFKENTEFRSTELKQLSIAEDIKKYTFDISQWHLDKKMPEMEKALREAWEKAMEKGTTTDPMEGQHADPFPKDEPPDWKSIDTSDMSHAEAVKVWEREHKDALESGDPERINNATRKLREAMGPRVVPDPLEMREPTRLEADMAQANQGRRRDNTIRTLIKNDHLWNKNDSTFFTNKWDIFGGDDVDKNAYKDLQTFGKAPKGSAAYENYWKTIDIMGTFTDAERNYVNDNNSINAVVKEAMTESTGQRLVELLTELRDNTKELHLESIP
jgi:hypothetical protein